MRFFRPFWHDIQGKIAEMQEAIEKEEAWKIAKLLAAPLLQMVLIATFVFVISTFLSSFERWDRLRRQETLEDRVKALTVSLNNSAKTIQSRQR